MIKSHTPHKPPTPRRSNLASCILSTIFIIFIVIIILILYFTLLKPKDPTISVTDVHLPTFSATNSSTIAFTFSQYAAVNNPNRAAFSHYATSLQLLYGGTHVGFMFIPAGTLAAGRTQYFAATFSVKPFTVSGTGQPDSVGPTVTDGLGGVRVGHSMEVESKLEMAGRVRIMYFFTHHVEARVGCRVSISVGDGSVLGFHCL